MAAETFKLLRDTYGEPSPSEPTCREWFRRFKCGDCDINDKNRSRFRGPPVEDSELQALLDETENELAHILGVGQATVFRRLHAIGMIRKDGKWVPH